MSTHFGNSFEDKLDLLSIKSSRNFVTISSRCSWFLKRNSYRGEKSRWELFALFRRAVWRCRASLRSDTSWRVAWHAEPLKGTTRRSTNRPSTTTSAAKIRAVAAARRPARKSSRLSRLSARIPRRTPRSRRTVTESTRTIAARCPTRVTVVSVPFSRPPPTGIPPARRARPQLPIVKVSGHAVCIFLSRRLSRGDFIRKLLRISQRRK